MRHRPGGVLDHVLERSLEHLRPLLAEHDDVHLVRLFAELWALAARDDTVAAAVRAFYDDYQEQVAAFLHARHPGLSDAFCQARARMFVMLMEGSALFRSGIAACRTEAANAQLVAVATTLLRDAVDN